MNEEIIKLKQEKYAEIEKYNQECGRLYKDFYSEKIKKINRQINELQKKEAE